MTAPATPTAGRTRHPQWESRLHELIVANAERPHEYGRWDCLVGISAAAVAAITGHDPARGHRRKYKSAAGAVRYLRSLGFDSPEAMIDSLLEEKPIGFAQRGDIVLVPGDEGGWPIPAVCMGGFALCIGTDGENVGLARVPRAQWLKAWAIGEHHSGKLKIRRSRRSQRSAAHQPSRAES